MFCKIEGCNKTYEANGYCGMHRKRLLRHGDPQFINPKCNRDGGAKERNRARTTKWKKDNWDTYKVYLAARKHRVKQATPPWADLAKIEEIYNNCPKGFHVDHEVPLNGKNICGLHIHTNLKVIPALDNLKKSNKQG